MPESFLPIVGLIRRELVSSLRQPRYFYATLFAVIAACIGVIALWPRENSTPWEMRSASQGMVTFFGFTLGLGAVLTVPALAGSSIVSEREEETFELLAMTTARPWHVIVAKFVNSAGHYLLLVVAMTPAAASAYFLVGLDITMLLRILLIVSSTALACAAAGVVSSAILRRPMAAVGVSYLAMITILGFPQLLLLLVIELLDVARMDPLLTKFGMFTMPLLAFVVAINGGPGNAVNKFPVETCSACCVFLALVLIVIAHLLVRRHWGMPTERATPPPEKTGERARAPRVPLFQMYRNPVYVHERWFEYPMTGWTLFLVVAVPFALSFSACGLIVLIRVLNDQSASEDAYIGWQILQAVLLPALLIAMTGNLFTKEQERSNLDALRMTLLNSGEIYWGKLRATLRACGIMLAAAAIGATPLLLWPPLWSGEGVINMFGASIMILECMFVAWAVSGWASLRTRRMASSLVLAYVLTAFCLFGNALIFGLLGNTISGFYLNERWMGLISPYFAFALIFSGRPNYDEWTGVWLASHVVMATLVTAPLTSGYRLLVTRHLRER